MSFFFSQHVLQLLAVARSQTPKKQTVILMECIRGGLTVGTAQQLYHTGCNEAQWKDTNGKC